MKVVICGGGIAGLTLSWWLSRDGHRVVLVDRSKGLRDEGYMIDFFGSGWDVAERMGLLDKLEGIHYQIDELTFVDEDGRRRSSVPYPRLRRLFDDRHFNFTRGELERVLFEALGDAVEVRFGTSVASFEDGGEEVEVTLTDGTSDAYDLLVGADGIHSHVRRLALDAGEEALRFLGFHTAAYVIDDNTLRDPNGGAFRTMTVPGRQVAVYPIRGGRLATFFVHDAERQPDGVAAVGEVLRAVYGDLGWVVPDLLACLPADEHVYFDTVSQVVLDRWSRGRVTLVGDACQAVSLLAGQGASMAMGGAWALAAELREAGSIEDALARYEARVKPAIERKQKAGRRMAKWFVPATRQRIALRDFMLRVSTKPGLSWLLRGILSGESIVR
ncbi:MAG: FAD-dependent monooxygenase [Alphaproteobacteria bacterium]